MPLLKVRAKVLYDQAYADSRNQSPGVLSRLRDKILKSAPPLRELGFHLEVEPYLDFTSVRILEQYPKAWGSGHIDRELVKERFWTWYYSDVTEQQKERFDILLYFTGHYFGVNAYGGGHIVGGFPKSRLIIYGDHPIVICHEILHLLGAGHADVNEHGHNIMEKNPGHHEQDDPMIIADHTWGHIDLSRTRGYYRNLKTHIDDNVEPPQLEPTYTLSQVIEIANYMFRDGPRPMFDVDVNKDGVENMTDILYVLNELFGEG